jgi:hypothetical protein
VYDSAERADTLTLFLLYPFMYFVARSLSSTKGLGMDFCSHARDADPYSTEMYNFFYIEDAGFSFGV